MKHLCMAPLKNARGPSNKYIDLAILVLSIYVVL